ncbi:MAG TPA: cytochrome d ubiquinol oxidase subunit II [Acetobacteraceae bacterium]|jgi:cytochrome bd ubiquinol oxidase subunit II|nr:cytochrome d ubiquinol oxidase subunit II [Acetobacteraceae bacterium]
MPEYEILRLLWWALLGVLLIGIAVMDGFDLGTAILLPWIGRTDMERRIVINTVGPVWEGNQVWFILGGGAIFAAWPPLYAVAFSGFYLAMLLLLCAMILRPVGFKFRSKLPGAGWRTTWDWALFAGGLVPSLVFGVAFGNVLQGVPFQFDDTLRMTYAGSVFGLFSPFALLCGIVSVTMLTMHGAAWLACKTEGAPRERAQNAGTLAAILLAVLFVAGGLWASRLDFYALQSFGGVNGPSNPLAKHVVLQSGALMNNYTAQPWFMLAPGLGVASALLTALLLRTRRLRVLAFLFSGIAIAAVIATAGLSMFPFLMPSSLAPDSSLIVWDASSSATTLLIMTVATVVLLPIVLVYTAWVYRVLRGPVTEAQIEADLHTSY